MSKTIINSLLILVVCLGLAFGEATRRTNGEGGSSELAAEVTSPASWDLFLYPNADIGIAGVEYQNAPNGGARLFTVAAEFNSPASWGGLTENDYTTGISRHADRSIRSKKGSNTIMNSDVLTVAESEVLSSA